MISRIELLQVITDYRNECEEQNQKPQGNVLAKRIGVAPQTIYNILSGYYAPNKPYTDTPSHRRRIDNADFEVIRGLFD